MQLPRHTFELELTHLCNNRCPHCFNDPQLSRSKNAFMSFEDTCRLVEVIAREFSLTNSRFIFTGGEPTLHPQLTELIAYVRNQEATSSIVMLTNGRNLKNPAFCKRLYDAGLNSLQITLNSCKPAVHDAMVGISGAWKETVEGIETALVCHPLQGTQHVSVTLTLTTLNIGHVLETVRFLAELGVKIIGANYCTPSGHGAKKPELTPEREKILMAMIDSVSLAKELNVSFGPRISLNLCTENWARQRGVRHYACGKGRSVIEFNPLGELYFCAPWGKTMGNVLATGSILSLFDTPLSKFYWNGCHLPDKCRACNQLSECGGVCPIMQDSLDCDSIYISKQTGETSEQIHPANPSLDK